MSRKTKSSRTSVAGVDRIASKGYVTEYRLRKNGLRILHARVVNSPTITTNIVYHVGSQHEENGLTGLAHMLEHMLFKPLIAKGLTWKELEERGALLNATTWLDRTMYYFTLPNKYLNSMLNVEATRMRQVNISDHEFKPEQANVLSEFEMYNSRPEIALEWNIVAAAFQSHGYKHDTIGFRGDIESFTTQKLKDFYDRYYWPNNATLIIAGDLSEKALLSAVKKNFASIQSGPILKQTNSREPVQEGQRRVVLERKTPIRILNIAFKAPSFSNREWTGLQLALCYLAGDKTSELYKKLVNTNMATAVHGNIRPTKDSFLASIEVYVSQNTPYEDVENIVFEAISVCTKKVLTNTKLVELKESVYSSELFSRDGTYNVAQNLAECVATGDWTRYFESLSEIKHITAKEVQRTATTYLQRSQSTVGTIEQPTFV